MVNCHTHTATRAHCHKWPFEFYIVPILYKLINPRTCSRITATFRLVGTSTLSIVAARRIRSARSDVSSVLMGKQGDWVSSQKGETQTHFDHKPDRRLAVNSENTVEDKSLTITSMLQSHAVHATHIVSQKISSRRDTNGLTHDPWPIFLTHGREISGGPMGPSRGCQLGGELTISLSSQFGTCPRHQWVNEEEIKLEGGEGMITSKIHDFKIGGKTHFDHTPTRHLAAANSANTISKNQYPRSYWWNPDETRPDENPGDSQWSQTPSWNFATANSAVSKGQCQIFSVPGINRVLIASFSCRWHQPPYSHVTISWCPFNTFFVAKHNILFFSTPYYTR